VRRVSVVGSPGSGKSTLAAALAERLGVAHVELDGLFHQPGWAPAPTEQFQADVADAIAGDGWVTDGNYSVVQATIWQHADTVIWYDLPRWQIMRQIVWRTVHRAARRVELWNGNRERWANLFSRDPANSIIVWAWQQYPNYRSRYAAAMVDPRWERIRFIRVRSPTQAQQLLDRLSQPPS
jgi:adenylate kinase family enzyme